MKILYDFQIFEKQRFGGVSRYFYELLNRFEQNRDSEWELPVKYSNNEYLGRLTSLKGTFRKIPNHYQDFLKGINFRGKWRLYQLRNKFFAGINSDDFSRANRNSSIARLRTGEYDIFHPTYYDDYFLEHLPGDRPFVITVYDMLHEIYPECFLSGFLASPRKKILVQKAARIIAISETTKRDLVNIFQIPESKITVIPLASSFEAGVNPPDFNSLKNLPAQYLLFVGERGGYKNFYFFVQSAAELLRENPKLQIVCVGNGFGADEKRFFESLKLAGRIKQYAVNDAGLAYLYQNAAAFVFPSLYEGFGIPVLEAFSCGCPAILSATASLPEVGGDAALYFDPKDGRAIQEAVSRAIKDEGLRRELIQKGKNRVKDFSWAKTARLTKEVYAEIA